MEHEFYLQFYRLANYEIEFMAFGQRLDQGYMQSWSYAWFCFIFFCFIQGGAHQRSGKANRFNFKLYCVRIVGNNGTGKREPASSTASKESPFRIRRTFIR